VLGARWQVALGAQHFVALVVCFGLVELVEEVQTVKELAEGS